MTRVLNKKQENNKKQPPRQNLLEQSFFRLILVYVVEAEDFWGEVQAKRQEREQSWLAVAPQGHHISLGYDHHIVLLERRQGLHHLDVCWPQYKLLMCLLLLRQGQGQAGEPCLLEPG
mmetsp:Transcript_13226/g.35938  ORF Transcript_13226/g.35938 Transcript_13226/m.35938 type:complete len:118 (-) Transcript_13226:358-711(-)